MEDCDAEGAIAAIDRLRSGAITGLNVTMPHKVLAANASDVREERVEVLGAANTLFVREGLVHAANTDVDGVRRSVQRFGHPIERAVVLGAGGAAAAAALALEGTPEVVVIARKSAAAEALNERIAEVICSTHLAAHEWGAEPALQAVRAADLVVNATPLGMQDPAQADAAFRALGLPSSGAHLLDLIYARTRTPFLAFANADAMDGATMLVEQGASAFEIWTGRAAPVRVMYEALFGALGRPVPSRCGPAGS